jgi:hypothetical protein
MGVKHADVAVIEFAMALWLFAVLLWAFGPWLGKMLGNRRVPARLLTWPKIGAAMVFGGGVFLLLWHWAAVVRVFKDWQQ